MAVRKMCPSARLPPRARIAVGSHVRTALKRKDFHRAFAPKSSEQGFVVSKQLRTNPPTYALRKLNGKAIGGTYYEQQLLPVSIMPTPNSAIVITQGIEQEANV